MSLSEVLIEGTIKPDGTLELDEKPKLSPGRVTVVLRQESEPTQSNEGWWPFLQQVRAEREAAGYHFMNEAEMEAHIQWLREDEDRIDRIRREMDSESASRREPDAHLLRQRHPDLLPGRVRRCSRLVPRHGWRSYGRLATCLPSPTWSGWSAGCSPSALGMRFGLLTTITCSPNPTSPSFQSLPPSLIGPPSFEPGITSRQPTRCTWPLRSNRVAIAF